MKLRTALPMPLLVLVAAFASAQTTYTLQASVGGGRGTGTTFSAYQMDFGQVQVSELTVASSYFHCADQTTAYLGDVQFSLNGQTEPCAPVLAGTIFGANITTTTVYLGVSHTCTGPGSVHVPFVGGSFDLTLSYHWGYTSGHPIFKGCFRDIPSGTMTLQ